MASDRLSAFETAASLWELVEARATLSPDALFAVDETDRRYTFSEYRDAAVSAAAGFAALGVRAGSVVSWMLPTRLEAMVIASALARLGAVQNLILPAYRQRELGFVLRQVRPSLLLVPSQFRGVDYPALAREAAGPNGPRIETIDHTLPDGATAALPPLPRADDATRWIFYTSGTTASPKGVRHNDRTLLASARGLARALELGPGDRHALVFPFTHVGGCLFLMANLLGGAAQIVVEQFDPNTTIPLLARHGVTHAGAGTVFHQAYLAAQRATPEKLLTRVRAFPGGGATKPPQLHFDLKNACGGAGIVSGYGLTECPAVTMHSLRDSDETLAHTEGRPNPPGAVVRIVREGGSDAPVGEEGEIRVRGPQLFLGYVDAALDREAIDAQGFFRTGDLGRLDGEGHLTVTGRLKDIIIRKGENISAKEVEDLLYTHPRIADAAVIGLPDPVLGERCCAVVVARGSLTLADVVAHLKAAGLMTQKIPEQLELLDALPRNASGKVEKRALQKRLSR